jgi:hypothetical protein
MTELPFGASAPASVKRENAIVVATGAAKDELGYLAQTVIANNVCHLTTRAGILLTAHTADSYSDTGARTIVSANIVSQAELANTGTAEERGGIAIQGAREAVIVNNLVLDTSAGTLDGAGIKCSRLHSRDRLSDLWEHRQECVREPVSR